MRHENQKFIDDGYQHYLDLKNISQDKKVEPENNTSNLDDENYKEYLDAIKTENLKKEQTIDKQEEIEINPRKIHRSQIESVEPKQIMSRLKDEKNRLKKIQYTGELTSKEIRENYKDRMSEIVDECRRKQITDVVFLDKGARLLAGFFAKVWEVENTKFQKPQISFINIGTEKMKGEIFSFSPDDLDDISPELAKIVKDVSKQLLETYGDKFTNKKILLLDEYCHEGSSLSLAYYVFKKNYPNSKIFADWFEWDNDADSVCDKLNMLTNKIGYETNYGSNWLRKIEKGVIEPENINNINAQSWTQKDFNIEERNDYIKKMILYRNQFKKMALELFSDNDNF